MNRAVSLFFTGLLMGCVAVNPASFPTFDPKEVAWSEGKGPNHITGTAVLKLPDGQTRTCRPYTVIATPDSELARARLTALYGTTGRGHRDANAPQVCLPSDPAYAQTQRTASCDDQGRFRFDHLPDGTWYIAVPVVWQNKVGEPFHGGTFLERVTLEGGETKQVTLGY